MYYNKSLSLFKYLFMTNKYFLLLIILMSLIACKDSNKNVENLGLPKSQKGNIIQLEEPVKLNSEAATLVETWKEYRNFNELFNQYKSTTPSVALSNAKELNTLAVQLKDSIRILPLNIPAFQARLDVLQNETLRLLDMTSISNLKTDDIKNQIIKILEAYNATNAKLNNIVSLQALEIGLEYQSIDSTRVKKVIPPSNIPHGVKLKQN